MKADLMVCSYLTGHMYYRSPYESFNSCRNCDGARCGYCKEKWMIIEFDDLELIPGGEIYGFDTKENAELWAESLLAEKGVKERNIDILII